MKRPIDSTELGCFKKRRVLDPYKTVVFESLRQPFKGNEDLMRTTVEFIDDRFESIWELVEMLNYNMKTIILDQGWKSSRFCQSNSCGQINFMLEDDWNDLSGKTCRVWSKQEKEAETGINGLSIVEYTTEKDARKQMFKALKREILEALEYEATHAVVRFNETEALVGLQIGWIQCAFLKIMDIPKTHPLRKLKTPHIYRRTTPPF